MFALIHHVDDVRWTWRSVDSLCRNIYAILKQKPYNFTINILKVYLSSQTSCLSVFVISKTYISGQKPRGRQPNAKVCSSKSAIFVFFLYYNHFVQTTISCKQFKYSPSFSTKLMLITSMELYITQRLHSFKFTLVNKNHLQHSDEPWPPQRS